MTTSRRIYIAGPMSGYPGFNYPAFDRAQEQLAAAGFDPVSPADPAQRSPNDPDELAPGVSYEDCLARAIEKLTSADVLAALPGWEQSHGARLEIALAGRRGMEVRPVGLWLESDDHPGAAFGLPPISAIDPMGPMPERADSQPVADRTGDGPLDPLQVAEIEAHAWTVMIDPTGTTASLRASLMRLGDKLRKKKHQEGAPR